MSRARPANRQSPAGKQKVRPAAADRTILSVQIELVARATVTTGAIVAATRTATLTTAAAPAEGATEGPLLSLEHTPRLAGRDGHTTGHARSGGEQQCVARSCPGRHDVDTGLASQPVSYTH